jgi:hypothetical protein
LARLPNEIRIEDRTGITDEIISLETTPTLSGQQANQIMSRTDSLWPFNKALALVAMPGIWALIGLTVLIVHKAADWPDSDSGKIILYIALVAGSLPLALVLIDFIAERRAVLDIKGVKIDFSRIELRQDSSGLPENIGEPGVLLSDSSPMKIVATLKRATASEMVRLDLKDGNGWWTTRLLALTAGAVRAGSPQVLIFTGQKESVSASFLGWAKPSDVLKALLDDNPEYRDRYNRARMIAGQLSLFGRKTPIAPPNPADLWPTTDIPAQDVQRYLNDHQYLELGDAALEQIFLDQLVRTHGPNGQPIQSFENPPERITLGRFHQLFEHIICRAAIDLNWPRDKQLAAFWDSDARYIALVRGGKFDSLLKRDTAEHFIMKRFFSRDQLAAGAQREKAMATD